MNDRYRGAISEVFFDLTVRVSTISGDIFARMPSAWEHDKTKVGLKGTVERVYGAKPAQWIFYPSQRQ